MRFPWGFFTYFAVLFTLLILVIVADFALNSDEWYKQWCIQGGGTAVEQPAGTYQDCIK